MRNGDIVGHADIDAAIRAVGRSTRALAASSTPRERPAAKLVTAITAAPSRYDAATGQPHAAHTLNRVPCVYAGRAATIADDDSLGHRADAARDDGPPHRPR
jgi:bisphosphoglycerate-independent phosphoglycerate mutase (AlkP superfamily)